MGKAAAATDGRGAGVDPTTGRLPRMGRRRRRKRRKRRVMVTWTDTRSTTMMASKTRSRQRDHRSRQRATTTVGQGAKTERSDRATTANGKVHHHHRHGDSVLFDLHDRHYFLPAPLAELCSRMRWVKRNDFQCSGPTEARGRSKKKCPKSRQGCFGEDALLNVL